MSAIQPAQRIGKTFQNPVPTRQTTENFFKLTWKFITAKGEREPATPIGPFPVDIAGYAKPSVSGLRITWMGHSSLMIEIDGKRLLTDPVVGPRASFVSFMGPKRFFPYPLPLAQLPPIDGLILSHDHYDHLDKNAMKELSSANFPIFCSLGVGGHLVKWGIQQSRITEMDWGQTATVRDGVSITATPARHFTGRGIINRNQTLWSSFVIKGPEHNIFFGADSGWFPGFKDIGDIYGPFDLTMLEVGASDPAWPDIHMGPYKATDAHLALKGNLMMPIHWGTFNLALHPWKEPIETSIQLAQQKDIQLFIPKPGIITEVTGPHNSRWWE